MFTIYMDSGTSNTRIFLTRDARLVDMEKVDVGTKDSAVMGSNDVLLLRTKAGVDSLLLRNGLTDRDIQDIWMSGMVTNAFGIVEVEHLSVPLDCGKLLEGIYRHEETKVFQRELKLVRGVKTARSGEMVDFTNIAGMNNARGEEIEVMGMVAKGILPYHERCVMISPGSHTHSCHVHEGRILDIMSNFTGELNHAIRKDTILAGELLDEDVAMDPRHLIFAYEALRKYGFTRALYIIHATKVFNMAGNAERNQLLAGILSGSVIESLETKIGGDWGEIDRIVVIGGKRYVESYAILARHAFPGVTVETIDNDERDSFALQGFYALQQLSLTRREEGAESLHLKG